MANRPAVHAPRWPSLIYGAATGPGQRSAGSAALEPPPALCFETVPPSEGPGALPPAPAPAEAAATRCQPSGLGMENVVGSCQANGSDESCAPSVAPPRRPVPSCPRPRPHRRRLRSAEVVGQLPTTPRAQSTSSLCRTTHRGLLASKPRQEATQALPAPGTVQMRKLRESRSHNELGVGPGGQSEPLPVTGCRAPSPATRPSFSVATATPTPQGRGAGILRRGAAWGAG